MNQKTKIDELILEDIKAHPGTSQNQVSVRLMEHYRSETYIRTCIKRLITKGIIQQEKEGNSLKLFLHNLSI